MPNLAQRGQKYLTYLWDRYVFDMKEDAPDLKVFFYLIRLLARSESEAGEVPEEPSSDTEPENNPVPQFQKMTMTSSISPEKARETALQSIRSVREWFEQYAPSSPVSVLLRQAERMIGAHDADEPQERKRWPYPCSPTTSALLSTIGNRLHRTVQTHGFQCRRDQQ